MLSQGNFKMIWVIIILSIVADSAWACSCGWGPHKQTEFCNSELVLRGKILKQRVTQSDGFGGDRVYTVEVIEVFRDVRKNSVTFKGGEIIEISTSKHGSLCGVRLDTDVDYLITAYSSKSTIRTALCTWTRRFSRISKAELNGIKGGYDCTCKVENMWIIGGTGPTDSCFYHRRMQCGYCQKQLSNESCTWVIEENDPNCNTVNK